MELIQPILDIHQLYQARVEFKKKRGAIDFETTETRIIFNDNRKIEKIVPVIRNDAHKIIEECMICANVAAAGRLNATGVRRLDGASGRGDATNSRHQPSQS